MTSARTTCGVNDVIIVLSRPSESGNMGAVCRVIKNMGFSHLRVVAPENVNEEQIAARAVHAFDIWQAAPRYATLGEALADCTLAIGTTRRRGEHRKTSTLSARELAAFVTARRHGGGQQHAGDRIALVFGNERTGLESAELALCDLASHIPVAPVFPSLNVSHAVQIYCYEFFLALAAPESGAAGGHRAADAPCTALESAPNGGQSAGTADAHRVAGVPCTALESAPNGGQSAGTAGGHGAADAPCTAPNDGQSAGTADAHRAADAPCTAPPGQWVPLNHAEIGTLCDDACATLAKFGFYQKTPAQPQWTFFREVIARAGLTRREAEYLRNIILKAAGVKARS